ncbi:MAG: type II secretion system protein [Verrucomicrobiota bacterium]
MKSQNGMTLTEIMIAMSILVILAGGIIAGVFAVRADAENNLYESASLNAAISFLEQTKSENYDDLGDPPTNGSGQRILNYIVGFKEFLDVPLSTDTVINVPIISDEDGEVKKDLDVTINIDISASTDLNGYWITVAYSWDHPTTDRSYSGEVRGFRSEVSTY